MSSRNDKTLKQQKEKHHAILRELVQEPANKTCADCLAKGPRWSSWSLGVFVCIRCAGIHRNLGTHISKVKSVDLDSWSVEQIEHILKWGNKRAAEYYECYLPKDFTRPQGNHAVETFIRNKYEKKLYIMKDGEPEPNPQSKLDRLKGNTSSVSEKENKNVSQSKRRERPEKKPEQKPTPNETILSMSKENQIPNGSSLINQHNLSVHHQSQTKSSSMNDLLSLDTPAPKAVVPVKTSASSDDLLSFGAFSSPVACNDQTPNDNLFGETKEPASNNSQDLNDISNQAPAKSTKESILSLYASSSMSQQQPVYGVPGGVYMTPQQTMQQQMMMQQQQQPQQRMNMNYSYQSNPMAANQMNQMNMQMRNMHLNAAQQQQQTQFNKPQIHRFNPQQQQQQQQFNLNQFNMASTTSPSFNGQVAQPQYNMQYNNFNQTPVSNMQMSNFNMQSSMPSTNMSSWQANQMQSNNLMNSMQANNMMSGMQSSNMMNGMQSSNLMNGMQTNNLMNNMNSGHTMNNQLWN